ncbi:MULTISPECIES: helix-turn-helix domain-containing protein [Streptomyces]|uniref:Helix-turn-helix transcriptional regulator n=1 Tax=Streptomyces caniscabiei TaxID=2746961 RepID=A0ABU4MU37_9ACTN|nr:MULTISPECIES: helix-turn-helix transcriptional regulator [Streptomyces]MBE4737442.1 helix-turn-helix domain-containing protein [Streptomyces caniscabiei]MBE4756202.1 helix-turn-helix domain-containing protein [Streptomyces caniscabiei]MBE4769781.1 helix-turn-helix domain-containing protein [Streptomyces caniscabiei]MBE4787273.1 helix-turn-helix domain-containing protein [Streptomyces caniscabiei]MBE4795322.1 helix-turn-helix domain-containing protein [Streptomyces caniscabiei]
MVLGRRLRQLRERAGVSFEEAARAIEVTALTVRRMEKAEVGLRIPYVKELLRTYGVLGNEIEDFLSLAREANQPGWWHKFRDVLPEWFSAYVSLESEAAVIRLYEPQYVPGLLQTHDYAAALIRVGFPNASPEEVERHVALRLRRQDLLVKPEAPAVWAILDETVLRRPVGGPEVMRQQIDRLVEATERPKVRIQIMRFAAGPHPGAYGPFHYFRFGFSELPDIVYTEGLAGAQYVDQPVDVVTYLEVLDRMSVQAEPVARTRDILAALRKEL